LGLGLGCALAARPAAAEPKVGGAVQLSLSGSVLGYSSLKATLGDPTPEPTGLDVIQAGREPSLTTTQTSYGFPGAGSGFGVGFGLSDHWVLGAQLLFSGSKTSVAGSSADASTIEFLPRLEYAFGNSKVRPFFAAVAGIGHTSEKSSRTEGLGAANYVILTESSSTTYLLGGSVGAHAFLSDSFSIDPAFTLLGVFGSQTSNSSSGSADSVRETDSLSGYQVMFSIGLSGWLGGR
jgi:hypothetical protein